MPHPSNGDASWGARPPDALASLLAEAADVAGCLWHKGWAERNAGNLSFDVTEGLARHRPLPSRRDEQPLANAFPDLAGRSYWVTATGSRMRDLARSPQAGSGVVHVGKGGSTYAVGWGAGGFRPTSELVCHLAIHATLRRQQEPHRAVVHTHPTELIALSHAPEASEERLNRLLWSMIPETVLFVPQGLRLVPYMLPGSLAQAMVTAEGLARHSVVMWEKHGVLAVAATLGEAFDQIDTLNKSAQICLACKTAGFDPSGLSGEQIAELRRTFVKNQP